MSAACVGTTTGRELAAFPIVAHVLHNDGDGWVDVTPNGLADAGSTILPTTPAVWIAPEAVETDGNADAGFLTP